jgi:arylsulfatase A-like enzyme
MVGCGAAPEQGVLRVLPEGVRERALESGGVSRMGFAAAAGRTVRFSIRVPRSASRLVLACAVPNEAREPVVCRASLGRPGRQGNIVFEQAVEPGAWHEHGIPMEVYRGNEVEVHLTSEAPAARTNVYWATPAVLCSSDDRPNVLLISIDSLRADHLGCYGYKRNTTPTLDSLAASGTVFTDAIAQSSWTLPSHVSLLTSLYSKTHGVSTVREGLGPEVVTLAETMRAAGYVTGAFVSGHLMLPLYGMAQGFDVYDAACVRASPEDRHTDSTSPCVNERVSNWLSERRDAPFFLFVHYWDVHFDYTPPAPFDTLFDPNYQGQLDGSDFAHNQHISPGMPPRDLAHLVALYDGEIAFTDMHIGLLMRELRSHGLRDRTVVVVTSDHGDEFFEHGGKGHGHSLFQELVRVPLILVDPSGTTEGRVVQDLAQLVDVAPTVLDLVGLPPDARHEGESLLPLIRAGSGGSRVAFSEVRRGRFLKAAFGNDAKVVYSVEDETTVAYDLRSDPEERAPLAPGEVPRTAGLIDALDAFLKEGSATLELRVTGLVLPTTLSLLFGEMPLEITPRGLEEDDEITTSREQASALLRLSCPRGDVDGATFVLPSATTTVKINGMIGSHLMRTSEVTLGEDQHPAALPVHMRVGARLLWLPDGKALGEVTARPGVYVWTPDTSAVGAESVVLDAALGERLKVLGYIE